MLRLILLLLCLATAALATDSIIADFEASDFDAWTVTGSAFGPGPAANVGRQKAIKGIRGKTLANSFHGDDKATGTLSSPPFTIAGEAITFFIGGGNHPGQTCVKLLVADKIVRSATGNNKNDLRPVAWDVRELAGKEAFIRIVDSHAGRWGFVSADHFVMAEELPKNLSIQAPNIQQAEAGREAFMSTVSIPEGYDFTLFADKDMVTQPTAICFDSQNRLYVAETLRWRKGVEDNRNYRYWLLDDAMVQSTDERLAMYEKWAAQDKKPMSYFTDHSEIVRILTDADGDGKADTSEIFADGFDSALHGTAGGLIERDGSVYFACIPAVYKLQDKDGDNKAEIREVLQDGFGVRVSISGHDMNGFAWGPDGKLYWTIGDRGYNLTTKDGRHLKAPYEGAVFRCYPDGSDFEVFYHTLRNPKEIAFDAYGNLFTVDNDSSGRDQSRVHYLLEGGEAGWHSGHQLIQDFSREVGIDTKRPNMWYEEGVWQMRHENQTATILPPIGHVSAGPCGLVYNPGAVALPEKYDGYFFLGDYRASPNKSGVHAFRCDPVGAGFSMVDAHAFVWGVACTDVDFGYDGKFYIADFVGGWTGSGTGYLYTLHDPSVANPAISEVRKLFAEGFEQRSPDELYKLLFHVDQRVRQRAQFKLADRDAEAELTKAFRQTDNRLARLHGLWGLAQIGAFGPEHIADPDSVIRGAAARIAGDSGEVLLGLDMVPLLADESLHTRSLAAIAIGKIKHKPALPAVLKMLRENDNADVYIRHGGVMALTGIATPEQLAALGSAGGSPAIRLAAMLALRRLRNPQIAGYLKDSDPLVLADTIRAINDLPIDGARQALAAYLDEADDDLSQLQLNRLINANFREGTARCLERLFRYAVSETAPEVNRVEALRCIGDWAKPHVVDPTIGLYRPLPTRDERHTPLIREQLAKALPSLRGSALTAGIRLATQYSVPINTVVLAVQAFDTSLDGELRAAALDKLAKTNPEITLSLIPGLLEERAIARPALDTLASLDTVAAFTAAKSAIAGKDLRTSQHAWGLLGSLDAPGVTHFVANAKFDDPRTTLDILEAARTRKMPFDSVPLAGTKEGGDPVNGQELFETHGSAQCLVCHKLGKNGGDVGPKLDGIAKKGLEQVWRSIVDPQAEIAAGFGIISVTMKDERVIAGAFIKETAKAITVKPPEGKLLTLPIAEIANRTTPISGMPNMGLILKPTEIRDIVAYLMTLK
ncbi:MAG: quinoprotein glucose dehydrogenase [Rhodothermales bacterium]|jgi:quinoprotein glucose dehydrogenase